MKRALFVGIDDYPSSPLPGCVAEAIAMATTLERHADKSRNYTTRVMTSDKEKVERSSLRSRIEELFDNSKDMQLLFYFSGHGAETSLGAELVTQDFQRGSMGVSMNDIISLANGSPAQEIVIILDCCFSGDIGNLLGIQATSVSSAFRLGTAVLREGVTLLTASRATQTAALVAGQSAFTRLLLEGLQGAAADHIGHVSVLSLYDFVSRAFDAYEQRPTFKSHLTQPSVLRVCKPPIDRDLLLALPDCFQAAESRVRMTPEHEGIRPIPTGIEPTAEQKLFDYFKCLRNAGLLTTEGNKDLYFIALDSEEVFLTASGRYFWRLAEGNKL